MVASLEYNTNHYCLIADRPALHADNTGSSYVVKEEILNSLSAAARADTAPVVSSNNPLHCL